MEHKQDLEYLILHSGVKGMRWGTHKNQSVKYKHIKRGKSIVAKFGKKTTSEIVRILKRLDENPDRNNPNYAKRTSFRANEFIADYLRHL